MLRISTVNVNGVRAAMRKGMEPWLTTSTSDLITMQEVRAANPIAPDLLEPLGWHVYSADAEAKGRAGVAILSKVPAKDVRIGNGDEYFDRAGRWLEADFELADGKLLTLVSAYVHSGEVDTPKQVDKYHFLDQMIARMPQLAEHADYAVVTGDLNVCHTELDLKNWKANRKKAGFLPEERAYFDRFFDADDIGWVDVQRSLAGEVPGPYTWWSQRGKAFDNDAGWRIDYHMATPALAESAQAFSIDRADSYAERWSDHAPLNVKYDISGPAAV
ncbi:exodeoxyribonuclease III [Brevibacterium sp. 50QC2O2]|jgi:exodeoxyribonuclease-3|uniref:exodeoxyribonuclease III n=1 Tax=Brevibacterium sp. 50QC2O2 TaxID=2968459 RepID=UPI00211BFF36|nr:exodeoxyribonuclease III [Brevibacterium sp. 50QC2O2]MCQ9389422.1 exodeoxyribonuclease III [Brevibacterium sp. 50QC2O2]